MTIAEPMPVILEELPVFWGILHCHVSSALCHKTTPFSPAECRQLEQQAGQLLRFARDERKLDFIAYADHHNMGGMIARGDVPDSPWRLIRSCNAQFHQPGTFVTLDGYEFQDGHEYNVFLHGSRKPPLANSWGQLIEQVRDGDPDIILAAHNRPSPTDWTFRLHTNFRLIEVINDGGVFETWANAGLQRGHRGGFYAGSDDHGCQPARFANTGVWAQSLTREAVWDALWNRRCLAAIGVRPQLTFSLNGHPMGSEVTARGKRLLRVSHAAAPLPLVCLCIKNGTALTQFTPPDKTFVHVFTDSSDSGNPFDYYYIKTLYPDGAVALTSPIWVRNRDTGAPSGTSAPKTQPLLPKARPCRVVTEWGQRVGYHSFTNAYPLFTPSMRWEKKIRDMVTHVGPEGICNGRAQAVIAPHMDGIAEYHPQGGIDCLHAFGPEDATLLITALVRMGDACLAAGYRDGNPVQLDLRGRLGEALSGFVPINPYLYGPRLVTPRYLADDGVFLYCLAARECLVAVPGAKGRLVASCQQGFPAFPVAVDAASLAHVYILSCDRTLVCYDVSAGQAGRLRWRLELPRAYVSLAAGSDGVWVFNEKIDNLSLTEPIDILRIDQDGRIVDRLTPDLVNIRGAALVRIGEDGFAAIHNPDKRASAIYRKTLNCQGRLRFFRIMP